MQFNFFYLSSKAILINAKPQKVVIEMFKIYDWLGLLSKNNLPKWHLSSQKNDKIKAIINYQKTLIRLDY